MLATARATRRADAVLGAIATALVEQGVVGGDLRFETLDPALAPGAFPSSRLAVDAPGEAAPLADAISAALANVEGATVSRATSETTERLRISLDGAEVSSIEIHSARVAAPPDAKPRIAIVIDDVGYAEGPVRELLAISDRLTFSVLPYAPNSGELAEEIHRSGAEVMLHLPMEPDGKPGGFSREGMLLSTMPPSILRDRVSEALRKIPHVRGVNNHMGSKLTALPAPMHVVMDELASRRLFFLDSRTTADTVALKAARKAGVPSAERDVFLDDTATVDAILAQVGELERRAKRRGSGIAIGHPYPETIRALQKAVPRLLERGFEIVPASELVVRREIQRPN